MLGQLSPSTGLIPKLIGRGGSELDWSQDPFLALSNEAASQTTGNHSDLAGDSLASQDLSATQKALEDDVRSLALFEDPPIQSNSSDPNSNPPLEGNPFRLVDHQTPVADVSSSNPSSRKPVATPNPPAASKPVANGESQLDRLKIALSQDAQTPSRSKPAADGAEVARQRVEAMMKNARRQIQLGEYVSALRWASAAEQLAGRSELFYGPDEDPPADLVRILQDRIDQQAEPVAPTAIAASEQPGPLPAAEEASQSAVFPIDVPGEPVDTDQSFAVAEFPDAFNEPTTQSHTTRAMKEAVIAPETKAQPEETLNSLEPMPVITPGQTHPRSLKIDARRVNANQGAAVTLEGQLNPPVESKMPQLPLAPPVMEEGQEIPPFAVAMIETRPLPSVTPPPLPPPSAMPTRVEPSETLPTPFLYADAENAPAPQPVKNVQWDEADDTEAELGWAWWLFPAMGMAGLALLGALLLLRKRA
jgi:hypothetical protein